MKTTLIKTTGQPMAACFGMPVSALSSVAPIALPGLGGFEGSDLSAMWTIERDERPLSALVAAVGANHGSVYATSAGNHQQAAQYNAERPFRGPDPWRDLT
ncbi:hypothetical protein [Streptacidiphilus cavernicola]|uniref:Uncharacterized protein n=1 Tax=Streptacidiphilus cavernicola TaxID=3342716 RepID=A0ABV6VUX7_9ACTN